MELPTLVLLPGLHGSARHFDRFVSHLRPQLPDWPILPLALPSQGPQDPQSLAEQIREKLPSSPFVLVAESFSGPTALLLGDHPHLKALVLVASFLSAPHPFSFALLPLRPLLSMKPPRIAVRKLLTGPDADDSLVESIRCEIATTPASTLTARIRAILSLEDLTFSLPPSLPVLLLLAQQDRLVPWEIQTELERILPQAEVHWIEGPHLLLQIAPKICANTLIKFLITNKLHAQKKVSHLTY